MPKESTRLQYSQNGRRSTYSNPFVSPPSEQPSHLNDSIVNAASFSVSFLRGCFSLWFLGVFSLAAKSAKLTPDWWSWYFAALPVWTGNLLLAGLQANLVLRVVLCFGQGRVLTEADYRILSMAPGSKTTLEHSISEDSTLLVTRATAGIILSVPVLLLVTATEILLCGYMETGSPGIWTCVAPLLLVQLVSVLQVLLIRNSPKATLCQLLLLLTTISIAHATDKKSPSWAIALLPIWLLNAGFFYHFVCIFSHFWSGLYQLRALQLLCGGLYLFGIVLTSSGEAMAVVNSSLPRDTEPDLFITIYFPLCSGIFGVFLFLVAACMVVQEHAQWLVVNRGFGEPMPLSITEDGGWEPLSENSDYYDFFLGSLVNKTQQGSLAPITTTIDVVSGMDTDEAAPAIHSDNYDSGCDSAAFNDIYGGNTTGGSGAEQSS